MEVQVDFLGIDAALKLVLVWHLFSHDGFCTESKLFILKVSLTCTQSFCIAYSFCKSIACIPLVVFSIAKGLATCQLGGVISTQKVLFCILFKIDFECFLCTNHIN